MSPDELERWSCTPYVSSIAYSIKQVLPGSDVRVIRRVAEGEGRILTRRAHAALARNACRAARRRLSCRRFFCRERHRAPHRNRFDESTRRRLGHGRIACSPPNNSCSPLLAEPSATPSAFSWLVWLAKKSSASAPQPSLLVLVVIRRTRSRSHPGRQRHPTAPRLPLRTRAHPPRRMMPAHQSLNSAPCSGASSAACLPPIVAPIRHSARPRRRCRRNRRPPQRSSRRQAPPHHRIPRLSAQT